MFRIGCVVPILTSFSLPYLNYLKMLRLSLSTEEYLMLGDDIKIVFLGGSNHHLRIMIDAPKEVNIVRSTVLKKTIRN